MTYRERYQKAHQEWFKVQFPLAYSSGHYCNPKYPVIRKANGLTMFIVNYLNWTNNYGNRINTMGKLVDGVQRQESGTELIVKKWLPSTTRRGTADINAIIKDSNGIGRSCQIEIKINDKQSMFQVAEEARVTTAGGFYVIVHNPDEFFSFYDKITNL